MFRLCPQEKKRMGLHWVWLDQARSDVIFPVTRTSRFPWWPRQTVRKSEKGYDVVIDRVIARLPSMKKGVGGRPEDISWAGSAISYSTSFSACRSRIFRWIAGDRRDAWRALQYAGKHELLSLWNDIFRKQKGFRIAEVPVSFKDRRYGRFKDQPYCGSPESVV